MREWRWIKWWRNLLYQYRYVQIYCRSSGNKSNCHMTKYLHLRVILMRTFQTLNFSSKFPRGIQPQTLPKCEFLFNCFLVYDLATNKKNHTHWEPCHLAIETKCLFPIQLVPLKLSAVFLIFLFALLPLNKQINK